MSTHRLALCASVVLLAGTIASARPNFGRNCSDCHNGGEPAVPALSVVGFDGMVDPDESATGATDRGLLKFFEVAPGGTLDLQVMVDFGNLQDHVYAVELKRMEIPGVEGFGTLDYTGDSGWFFQIGDTFPDPTRPYFTSTETDGVLFTEPQLLTYTMQIGAATDPDFYDLEFAMAGQPGFFYTDEHFYVHVTPEPGSVSLMAFGLGLCAWRRRGVR